MKNNLNVMSIIGDEKRVADILSIIEDEKESHTFYLSDEKKIVADCLSVIEKEMCQRLYACRKKNKFFMQWILVASDSWVAVNVRMRDILMVCFLVTSSINA